MKSKVLFRFYNGGLGRLLIDYLLLLLRRIRVK